MDKVVSDYQVSAGFGCITRTLHCTVPVRMLPVYSSYCTSRNTTATRSKLENDTKGKGRARLRETSQKTLSNWSESKEAKGEEEDKIHSFSINP